MATTHINPRNNQLAQREGISPREGLGVYVTKRAAFSGNLERGALLAYSLSSGTPGVRPIRDGETPQYQAFTSGNYSIGDYIVVEVIDAPYQLIWSGGTSSGVSGRIWGSSPSIGTHYIDTFMHRVHHEYESVWAKVKDWVSDEQITVNGITKPARTGEDYYMLITKAPGFCDVRYDGKHYVFGIERYNQNIWSDCRDKPDIDFAQFKAFLFQYEFNHKKALWALRIQHKTDRDGPCQTCRMLMEKVPVEVEGILL